MSRPSNPDAFPHPASPTAEVDSDGMTLRDYFAAQVVARMIPDYVYVPAVVAEEAYQLADAMLAEREK